MDKKYTRRMKGPPHNIQNPDQSMTKFLHHTRRPIQNYLVHLRIYISVISSIPG